MLSEVETTYCKSTFVCFDYAQHDKSTFTAQRNYIANLLQRVASTSRNDKI